MYSVDSYGRMIRDAGRTSAYARALRAAVKSDSVVLDIGTGPGMLALLACRCAARKVYAVESDEVIALAKQLRPTVLPIGSNSFRDFQPALIYPKRSR